MTVGPHRLLPVGLDSTINANDPICPHALAQRSASAHLHSLGSYDAGHEDDRTLMEVHRLHGGFRQPRTVIAGVFNQDASVALNPEQTVWRDRSGVDVYRHSPALMTRSTMPLLQAGSGSVHSGDLGK